MEVTLTDLINKAFDEIKHRHDLRSDAALARHIGVNNMAILRWRKGEIGHSLRIVGPLLIDYACDGEPVKIAS